MGNVITTNSKGKFFVMDTNNFKILELETKGNTYLGSKLFKFINDEELDSNFYTSIIIGPNGTGKSYILKTIIDAFREIDSIKMNHKKKRHVPGNYRIKYILNSIVYEFGNLKPVVDRRLIRAAATANGNPISIESLKTPENIIANTIMLTDKFPIVKHDFQQYKYLGVRKENSPSLAGTRTYAIRTVKYIVEGLTNRFIRDIVSKTLDFLELEKKLVVSYTPKYKNYFFTGSMTSEKFKDFYERFWVHTRRDKLSPPWSKKRFDSVYKDDPKKLEMLSNLCNHISRKLHPESPGSRKQIFSFDLLSEELDREQYLILEDLRKLDVITFPSIKLTKAKSNYDLNDSSSGESHFISSIIGIASMVGDNSLILLDEPEISLHPNWQMRYMGFLHETFKYFKGCHFIISSHSHFLISGLNNKSSSIIGIRKDREIVEDLINYDTYGWSAEEVLYKVFEVRTTRNYYLEMDLRKLLSLISENSNDKKKITELLSRISKVRLNDKDPLSLVISDAEKYLEAM